MKIQDIVFQLQSVLPTQTDLFNTTVSIISLTRSGSIVTATTSGAHNLVTGNYANIVGAKEPVSIISMTRRDDIVTVITNEKNDITKGRFDTVEIDGATEPDYNGTHNTYISNNDGTKNYNIAPVIDILTIERVNNIATVKTLQEHGFIAGNNFQVEIYGSPIAEYNGIKNVTAVPNVTGFSFEVGGNPDTIDQPFAFTMKVNAIQNDYVFFFTTSQTPTSPASGSPIVLQRQYLNKGYNGRYEITVIDPTTLTYELETGIEPNSPAVGSASLYTNPRISGIATIERGRNSYTQLNTNQLWAYVTLDDEITSKDRNTQNDSVASRVSNENDYRLTEIRNFSVYVFTPVTNEIASRMARDLMVDVKRYLYKALLRFNFPNDLSECDIVGSVVPVQNRIFEDNSGYLLHQFEFQITGDVTYNDTVESTYDVPFRCIDMKMINEITPTITDDSFNLEY